MTDHCVFVSVFDLLYFLYPMYLMNLVLYIFCL